MSVEGAIHHLLSTHPGLTALVGTRIYPVAAPPDLFATEEAQDNTGDTPTGAVIYTLISNPREASHDGPSGLGQARYQFDCLAAARRNGTPDQDTAAAVAKQVRLALHRAESAHDGDTVRGFLPAGARDIPDQLTGRGRRTIDFTCWHTEETP